MTRRILYFTHDNPKPCGGVREIYEHVRILVSRGYDAYVVPNAAGFRPTWFTQPQPAPLLHIGQRDQLRDDDLLIVPETYHLEPSAHQRVLFCQNHFYAFRGNWQQSGVSSAIASSEPIADFLRDNLAIAGVRTVPYVIEPELYKPAPSKLFQVAVMPRKRQEEAEFIYQYVSRRRPDLEWVVIDDHARERAAELLAESAIFLALGRFEGLGLPPLEAMACGCAVVGFTGFGGAEFATPENGLWVPEDDVLACAVQLLECVDRVRRSDPAIARMISRGRETAARYSPQRRERALLHAIQSLAKTLPRTLVS